MTVPRNSTVLRAAIVVDPAEPTQRFRYRAKILLRHYLDRYQNTPYSSYLGVLVFPTLGTPTIIIYNSNQWNVHSWVILSIIRAISG